jgi:hypothetical protein
MSCRAHLRSFENNRVTASDRIRYCPRGQNYRPVPWHNAQNDTRRLPDRNRRHPGLSDSIVSPVICVVSAAASRMTLTARLTLNATQAAVAPVSAAISEVNSGVCASRRSAALSSKARRLFGPVADHPVKACAAALTAMFASSTLAAAARVATSPVIGLRRSKVFPSLAAKCLSPISSSVSIYRLSLCSTVPRRQPTRYVDAPR